MSTRVRTMSRVGVVLLVLAGTSDRVLAQEVPGRIAITATQADDLQRWGSQVEGMVRNRDLVVRARYADRLRSELSHEVLAQYHQGVPVYGGEVRIHRSGGVAISILGSVYSNIDADTTATITPEEAGQIVESRSGATLGSALPTLTLYPIALGQFTLAYLATASNARTYVVDAHDGHIRLEYSERRTQTSTCRPGGSNCAVGVGIGQLGDQKKVSTTSAGGGFEARDSLRNAEYLTLDMRRSQGAMDRLSGENGAGPGFLSTDVARDADNSWSDTQVVDVHAHVGWVNDYLAKNQNYNGIDNQNIRVFSFVNVPEGTASSNAFWSPPPSGPEASGFMAYGEFPDGVALTAIDVVAHEISHALTTFRPAGNLVRFNVFGGERSDGCVPDGELPIVSNGIVIRTRPADFNFEGSGATFLCTPEGRYVGVANVAGAVGEGFGDVTGASVEHAYPNANVPDYDIGEDFPGVGPIRSMSNPGSRTNCFRFIDGALVLGQPCPDHFALRAEVPLITFPDGSIFYWGGGASDLGGEHINSTIFSHVFFLAIEGGTNSTSGIAVEGVGSANRAQVEEVFFSALLDGIPNSPGWDDVAAAILQAAVVRFGPTSAVTTNVAQALLAVGLLEF